MRHVRTYLRREWERVVCALLGVLLGLFVVDWALGSRHGDLRSGAGRINEPPSLLGPEAFAFLQDAAEAPARSRNPFLASAVARPAPRPERPPRRDTPKPPPAPVVAAPAPAPVVPAPTPAVPTPSPPAARLGLCDVRYVFSTVNRSGRPVALLELHNPANPGGQPLACNVSAGDLVHGLRIQSFTGEALVLTDASGRRHSVSFGGTRRVTVELGTER